MVMKDDQHFARAEVEVAQLLRERHNIDDPAKDDFEVMSMDQIIKIVNTVTSIISLLLGLLAAISLVVGGVGIMNIMLATVSERTREIGIRRAVGAAKEDIIIQFLVESVILTSAGGLAGVVTGIGGVWLITMLAGWKTAITLWSIMLPLGMSICVGVFFGLYPAYQAARMDPIAALRHE